MEFLPFFLILLASVLFSGAFRRFHLPWVLAMIVAGMVIGPHGLHLAETNETIEFMGSIGLVFLMFMAGLETRLSSFKEFGRGILTISFLNGVVPFCVGLVIGLSFDFSFISALLIGVIFMSSSVAVILPALEESKLIKRKIGRTVVASAVIVDVLSLVALSLILQNINTTTELALPTFYLIVGIILLTFGYFLPKIRNFLCRKLKDNDLFESEVRIILLMIVGTVIILDLLGLHPIIAGFFTGLVLSESIKSEQLIEKLHTISYGIFIPVFFIIIGFNTDLVVLFESKVALGLALVIILGSLISKYVSGRIGATLSGFGKKEAHVVGLATLPQLSTTLAVVYTAEQLGVLSNELVASMIALSMISVFISPFALRRVKLGVFVK